MARVLPRPTRPLGTAFIRMGVGSRSLADYLRRRSQSHSPLARRLP